MKTEKTKKNSKSRRLKKEAPKRFKWRRLRVGDDIVRLMNEDGCIFRSKGRIIRFEKKYIVCELLLANAAAGRNIPQEAFFDKKTGINKDGEIFGYLDFPKKRKNFSVIEKISQIKGESDEPKIEIFYSYCH